MMLPALALEFIADILEPLGFEDWEAANTQLAWRKRKPIDVRIYAWFDVLELKIRFEFYKGFYPQTRGHIQKELELDLNDPMSHEQLLTAVVDFIDE